MRCESTGTSIQHENGMSAVVSARDRISSCIGPAWTLAVGLCMGPAEVPTCECFKIRTVSAKKSLSQKGCPKFEISSSHRTLCETCTKTDTNFYQKRNSVSAKPIEPISRIQESSSESQYQTERYQINEPKRNNTPNR